VGICKNDNSHIQADQKLSFEPLEKEFLKMKEIRNQKALRILSFFIKFKLTAYQVIVKRVEWVALF
jgi:hypothetical protein